MQARIVSRLTALDFFFFFNTVLFVVLVSTRYWQRFLEFKTRANLSEFIVYASLVLVGIGIGWHALRRLRINGVVLLFVEVGILMHFSGGLFHLNDMRLYDLQLGISFFDYPLRYDKVVHFFNAFVGCLVALEIFRVLEVRARRLLVVLACLCVISIGSLIEIVEYVVVKTIPHNGVGDYDNNMTDLAANLIGCFTFALLRHILSRLGSRFRFLGLDDLANASNESRSKDRTKSA
ncbi:MAG: DUF2238 domain-containing protein [Pseudomonadota bacterium]